MQLIDRVPENEREPNSISCTEILTATDLSHYFRSQAHFRMIYRRQFGCTRFLHIILRLVHCCCCYTRVDVMHQVKAVYTRMLGVLGVYLQPIHQRRRCWLVGYCHHLRTLMNFGLARQAMTHHCVSSDHLFCLAAGKRYSGDADNVVLGFLWLACLYCCLCLGLVILQI